MKLKNRLFQVLTEKQYQSVVDSLANSQVNYVDKFCAEGPSVVKTKLRNCLTDKQISKIVDSLYPSQENYLTGLIKKDSRSNRPLNRRSNSFLSRRRSRPRFIDEAEEAKKEAESEEEEKADMEEEEEEKEKADMEEEEVKKEAESEEEEKADMEEEEEKADEDEDDYEASDEKTEKKTDRRNRRRLSMRDSFSNMGSGLHKEFYRTNPRRDSIATTRQKYLDKRADLWAHSQKSFNKFAIKQKLNAGK